MNEKSKTNYEKMASFNVMCYQVCEPDKFCIPVYDNIINLYDNKQRLPKGDAYIGIENIAQIDNNVIFFLSKYRLAKNTNFGISKKIDDTFESEPLDGRYFDSCNIGMYNKNTGILLYNKRDEATPFERFIDFINMREVFKNDFIAFTHITRNENSNIKSIKKLNFSFETEYFGAKQCQSKTMEQLALATQNLELKGYNITINIKKRHNDAYINTAKAKELMREANLTSLSAECINNDNELIKYHLDNFLLSHQDTIDNDKIRDFEYCKDKILSIYQTLFPAK